MLEELKSIANLKTELDNLAKKIFETNKGTKTLKELHGRSQSEVAPGDTCTIELLSGRNGCFKPTDIQLESSSKYIKFEILDVRIMGAPQLINYSGATISAQRGISNFYKNLQPVDWQAFGGCSGQGLQICVRNTHKSKAGMLYIRLKGYELPYEMLGQV